MVLQGTKIIVLQALELLNYGMHNTKTTSVTDPFGAMFYEPNRVKSQL